MMQQIYIYPLNKIFLFTKLIDERVRNAIIQLAWFFYAIFFTFKSSGDDIGDRMVWCSAVLVLIVMMSINGELKPVRWNRAAICSMIIFGLGIIAIGKLHYVGNGYMMFAIDLVLILPALYIVWINRGDYEKMYDMIAIAMIFAGLVDFVYILLNACRGEFDILDGRATGGTTSPNFLGMTGLVLLFSCQYFSLKYDGWAQAIILAISSGIGVSMMISSASRAAILAAIAITIVLIVFVIKTRGHDSRGVYNRPTILIASIILMLIAILAGLQMDNIQERVQEDNQGAYAAKTTSRTANYALVQTSVSEESPQSDDLDSLKERIVGSDDMYSFSSGRTVIWKAYLQEMNMFGNNYKEFKKNHPELPESRAHNNFIDYAFRCGIPLAILYLVFYATIGIKAVYKMFTVKENLAEWYFVIAITGTYALYALVEIATLTFIRIIPCLFFLSVAPLVGSRDTTR